MQATPRIVSGLPVSSRVNENSTSINKILFEIHLMELGPTHIVTRFDKQDLNNVTMIIMMKLISCTNSANFRGCYQDFSRSRRTSCLLLLAAACTGHRGIEFEVTASAGHVLDVQF